MAFLIIEPSPVPNIVLSTLFSNSLSLRSTWQQVSHPYKKKKKLRNVHHSRFQIQTFPLNSKVPPDEA
jgi:hypothetical protein